jgi:nucleotide-binding universal stress UspA family protein
VVAANPFLAGVKHVRLVCMVEHSEDETGASDMADYLSKSGLRVDRADLAADGDAGPALLEEATGKGVLLVMGAYGHWRWREWVFGGVTDCVLRKTAVPVLMMH